MPQQADWRYCQNCHTMFYDGFPAKGICPAAPRPPGGAVLLHPGPHVAQGFNFDLGYDAPETASAQANWRYCSKCGVIFYDGYPDKGQCMAGGGHEASGYNFTLPHDVAGNGNAQAAWRYCQACHAMYYDGYADKGHCPGNTTLAPTGIRLFGGHVAAGFDFVLPHDVAAPAPAPAPYTGVQFSNTGLVWVVSLDHDKAQNVASVLGDISSLAGKVIPVFGGAIAQAVGGAGTIIQLMDTLGGNQGVDIQGVAGVNGVIVTPHASGMYATLIQGAREGVSAAALVELLMKLGGMVPAFASTLDIQVASTVFAGVEAGTPLGWVLAGAFGAVVNLLQPAPDPNEHGGIHADRTTVGDWERLTMTHVPQGTHVAILAWQGLFSAQNGGGADVYANRPKLSDWETWTLIDNHDGTVSLQSINGHFLTAINGGGSGSYCLANATAIGNSERFYLQNLPGGQIALKTHDKGTFLSVQPGK